jgi:hypothetical protein
LSGATLRALGLVVAPRRDSCTNQFRTMSRVWVVMSVAKRDGAYFRAARNLCQGNFAIVFRVEPKFANLPINGPHGSHHLLARLLPSRPLSVNQRLVISRSRHRDTSMIQSSRSRTAACIPIHVLGSQSHSAARRRGSVSKSPMRSGKGFKLAIIWP